MTIGEDNYQVVPFPKERRLITDVGRVAQNKHVIRGLLELDVTKARRLIREYKEKTGEKLSFTAFLTACAGQAIGNEMIGTSTHIEIGSAGWFCLMK